MKNVLKRVYYLGQKSNRLLKYNLQLAYIFHTERIYEDEVFSKLTLFCKSYYELTGAKPICAVIPPTSLHIKNGLEDFGFSEDQFVERLHILSSLSTIGYHGHFYLKESLAEYNAIHCNNANASDISKQFTKDLNWFAKHQINHNGIYAAGWWFFNQTILDLLIKNGFEYDFSFSQAPYFYNQYSVKVMQDHDIDPGEPFLLKMPDNPSPITCIQNFIGLHNTPFPQDFNRNFEKLYEGKRVKPITIGVVNAHDYDLSYTHTLACIKHLMNHNKVQFHSFDSLKKVVGAIDLKTVNK